MKKEVFVGGGIILAAIVLAVLLFCFVPARKPGISKQVHGNSCFVSQYMEGINLFAITERKTTLKMHAEDLRLERLRLGFWRTALRNQACFKNVIIDIYCPGQIDNELRNDPASSRKVSPRIKQIEVLPRQTLRSSQVKANMVSLRKNISLSTALKGLNFEGIFPNQRSIAYIRIDGFVLRLHRGDKTIIFKAKSALLHHKKLEMKTLKLIMPNGVVLNAKRATLKNGQLQLRDNRQKYQVEVMDMFRKTF